MLKTKPKIAILLLSALLSVSLTGVQARSGSGGINPAQKAIEGGDYQTALKYLQPRADKGNAEAQCLLADLYAKGLGVQVSEKQAQDLYKAAACNKDGEVIDEATSPWPRNQKEFAQLMERVEKKEGPAENELGFLYQHGIAVKKDATQAEALYRKAADDNCSDALNNLAVLYSSEPESVHALSQVVDLLQRAVALGNTDAMANLGWLYERGKGVPKDYDRSLALTVKAAAHGVAAAQYNLGYLYQRGFGVERNLEMSELLYNKAKLNRQTRPALYFGFMAEKLALPKISSAYAKVKPSTRSSKVASIEGALGSVKTIR